MKKVDALENLVWLIANDKEAEFELFCKQHDLDEVHPVSLQLFINREKKAVEKEKEEKPFSLSNGFFVCWEDKFAGECRVFNQNKRDAQMLFANLKRDRQVELFECKNGQLKKIAWGVGYEQELMGKF